MMIDTELAVKVIFYILGFLIGLLIWVGKTMWNDIQKVKCDLISLKEDTGKSVNERFKAFLDTLDKKLDDWWKGVENSLMNDGRLPTKNIRKKSDKDV